ncbi:MAG: hypothetical protein ACRCUI_05915 [Polymorphobacter sp.]
MAPVVAGATSALHREMPSAADRSENPDVTRRRLRNRNQAGTPQERLQPTFIITTELV